MALVVRGNWDHLHSSVDVARHAKKVCATRLPFCRMSSAAAVIIAILMLAAALAAATLQKLMHATLSFAAALVGVAAFFFLFSAEFVGLVLVFVYIGAVAVLMVFTILMSLRAVGEERGATSGVVIFTFD